MIKGTGIDIIELSRVEAIVQKKERFIERILTKTEQKKFQTLQKHSRKIEFLAGRFAAKEAFAKAVGTGIGKLSFQHIEIVSNENGKPEIEVKGYKKENIFITISHSKTYAVAHVIITV